MEVEALNTQRLLLRIRTGFRKSNGFRQFLSGRGVVDARAPVARHFAAVGQFQAVEMRLPSRGWEQYNRAMGGAEFPFEREGFALTARVVGEHYWYGGEPDYNRHRERLVLRLSKVRFQPQFGAETIWDAEGRANARAISGLSFPFSPSLSLDAGYYYDVRPARQGGNRHVIFTILRIRRARR